MSVCLSCSKSNCICIEVSVYVEYYCYMVCITCGNTLWIRCILLLHVATDCSTLSPAAIYVLLPPVAGVCRQCHWWCSLAHLHTSASSVHTPTLVILYLCTCFCVYFILVCILLHLFSCTLEHLYTCTIVYLYILCICTYMYTCTLAKVPLQWTNLHCIKEEQCRAINDLCYSAPSVNYTSCWCHCWCSLHHCISEHCILHCRRWCHWCTGSSDHKAGISQPAPQNQINDHSDDDIGYFCCCWWRCLTYCRNPVHFT